MGRKVNNDMNIALNEISDKKLLLDVKVETQLILQLLVSKGIVTREEVTNMRITVKNSSLYKPLYDYLNSEEEKANYYKSNPEQYYKELLFGE